MFDESYSDFVLNFDAVENALDMRCLRRWNGRDFRKPENLSEHTHLVTVCAIELYDNLYKLNAECLKDTSVEKIVRMSLIHDSLEILRGDVLSITKDSIDGLRDTIDKEEDVFMRHVLRACNCDNLTKSIVKLADLKACYKYVERELMWPTNYYVSKVYKSTKDKFDAAWSDFKLKHGIFEKTEEANCENPFSKGYSSDAGVDILLKRDVTFMPLSTNKVDLEVSVTPTEKTMSFLCARTSAANKGLVVATCPIDPNYSGSICAIVHNVSNDIITYKKGESFCQVVTTPIDDSNLPMEAVIRKEGKRADGKLGSTGLTK